MEIPEVLFMTVGCSVTDQPQGYEHIFAKLDMTARCCRNIK